MDTMVTMAGFVGTQEVHNHVIRANYIRPSLIRTSFQTAPIGTLCHSPTAVVSIPAPERGYTFDFAGSFVFTVDRNDSTVLHGDCACSCGRD